MAEFELKALITGVDRFSRAVENAKENRGFKRRGRSVTGWLALAADWQRV